MPIPSRHLIIGASVAGILIAGALLWRFQTADWSDMIATVPDEPDTSAAAPPPLTQPLNRPVRLAIGPLGSAPGVSDAPIADLIVAILSADSNFQLVERRELDAALQEVERSMANASAREKGLHAGRLTRADWFLSGVATHLSGTNASLARIVDTPTGIVRDLTMILTPGKHPAALAEEWAAFARSARSASTTNRQTLIAIGAFTDVGVAAAPPGRAAQLQSSLIKALQTEPVLFVERELVADLLQELQISSAGLALPADTSAPMQAAVWIIDGFFQEFAGAQPEMELMLRLEKIGSGRWRRTVRSPHGDPFLAQLQSHLLAMLHSPEAKIRPRMLKGRKEMLAQLEHGLQRASLVERGYGIFRGEPGGFSLDDAPERRRDNLLDAIQAFEAVLLLDPDNAETKFYLAACLQDPTIDRAPEAHVLLQEIAAAASKKEDRDEAQTQLTEIAEFARTGIRRSRFFLRRASQQSQTAEARTLDGLRTSLRTALANARKRNYVSSLGEFSQLQPLTNKFLADDRLMPVIQTLRTEFPELEPYLYVRALHLASGTNSALVSSFRTSLASARSDPSAVFCPRSYFDQLLSHTWSWANEHNAVDLLEEIAETIESASRAGVVFRQNEDDLVRLGLILMHAQRWERALAIFESFGHRVTRTYIDRPCRGVEHPFLPFAAAAQCRAKLSRSAPPDDTTFAAPEPFALCGHPALTSVDGTRMWIARDHFLASIDLATRATAKFPLPGVPAPNGTCTNASPHCFSSYLSRLEADEHAFSAIAQNADTLWIGTEGAGLIAFNKSDHSVRRITAADGLVMNSIMALHFAGGRLWIGYGKVRAQGGVGSLSANGEIQWLRPALSDKNRADRSGPALIDDPSGSAPRLPVSAIAQSGPDELWLLVQNKGVQRFDLPLNTWRTFSVFAAPDSVGTIVPLPKAVAVASTERGGGQLSLQGIALFSPGQSEPSYLRSTNGLPHNAVTALATDGDKLWAGGCGFISVIDAPSKRVLKTSFIPAHTVENITVTPDAVWAQFNAALYRFPKNP